MKIKAKYTSVFDDSIKITSDCQYDVDNKVVSNIEPLDDLDDLDDIDGVDDANALTCEFVTLPDGTELTADDGVTFNY